MTAVRPELDTSGEPWVGRFPGLGEVRVDADGGVDVRPVEGPDHGEPIELRGQALRWGWGELLSLRRRGHDLLQGVAASPPPYDVAVLLGGDGRVAAAWFGLLADAGWRFLSDRPTPLTVGQGFTVVPRTGPILSSRSVVGEDLPAARQDTDAVLVDLPRHPGPLPLGAVVLLDRERVHREPVESVRGAERLTAALGLQTGGVLARDDLGPGERFTSAQALAALPLLRVRCDDGLPAADRVADVLAWVADRVAAR